MRNREKEDATAPAGPARGRVRGPGDDLRRLWLRDVENNQLIARDVELVVKYLRPLLPAYLVAILICGDAPQRESALGSVAGIDNVQHIFPPIRILVSEISDRGLDG